MVLFLEHDINTPIAKSTTAVIDYIYYDYTTTRVFATENHRIGGGGGSVDARRVFL